MVRRVTIALFLLFSTAPAPQRLSAQVGGPLQPPTTGGLPVLLQELRMLGHQKRVLMIGAHPDDEDTQLLVMFTRREGAEAAYLSLTRGEGGQNLIGNELGEALGILRTEELLAARNIDGAQQFFTRAYDFGFSKTIDDAWAHWPRDSVLKDVVRIVRRFRPQVIVSVFSGTPRDGHGQHQAAGWAAQEAFRIAGDPNRFPELATEEGLQPFAPTKLYIDAWFNPAAATLTLDGGEVEKLSGKTYHQLAMAARSLHRSQDMGNLQEFGPSPSRLMFKAVRGGTADVGEGWAGFWSGVDTTLHAPAAFLQGIADAKRAAGQDRVAVDDAIGRAFMALRGLPVDSLRAIDVGPLLRARSVVSWAFADAVADRATVGAGEPVDVTLTIRNAGGRPLEGVRSSLGLGFTAPPTFDPPPPLAIGETREVKHHVEIGPVAPATTPYYMRFPRRGDLYDWSAAGADRGTPRGSGAMVAAFESIYRRTDGRILVERRFAPTVSARVRDQAFGEVRHPVFVVPRIGVKLTPGVAIIRASASGEGRVVVADVELESGLLAPVDGSVTVEVPDGWPRPAPVSFRLSGVGAVTHIPIRIVVPAGVPAARYPIRAVATDAAGQTYCIGAFRINYPHIREQQYSRLADAQVEVVELTAPLARNVAYVRGAADKVPEALNAAGLHVTLLDSMALATADLSTYDAIVIGPRAYEVDSALVRNNQRLNEYARNGGRVVVQYQQQVYLDGSFAPYSLGGNSRITDERSPVTMLGASPTQSALAPVFRTPNAIGAEDWEGWIQDRALYCPSTWGREWNPLLAMNDPGEAPIRGCLLEAKVGRGSYVYSGMAFFRELPAGVPGAYRLFFNLLGGAPTP